MCRQGSSCKENERHWTSRVNAEHSCSLTNMFHVWFSVLNLYYPGGFLFHSILARYQVCDVLDLPRFVQQRNHADVLGLPGFLYEIRHLKFSGANLASLKMPVALAEIHNVFFSLPYTLVIISRFIAAFVSSSKKSYILFLRPDMITEILAPLLSPSKQSWSQYLKISHDFILTYLSLFIVHDYTSVLHQYKDLPPH